MASLEYLIACAQTLSWHWPQDTGYKLILPMGAHAHCHISVTDQIPFQSLTASASDLRAGRLWQPDSSQADTFSGLSLGILGVTAPRPELLMQSTPTHMPCADSGTTAGITLSAGPQD